MGTAAWTGGRLCGILAAVVGMLGYNFLFIPPLSSFHAVEPMDVLTLLVLLAASLGAVFVLVQMKGRARREVQRSRYAQVLLAAVQAMGKSKDGAELLYRAAQQMNRLLKRPILYAVAEEEGMQFHVCPPEMEEGQLPMYDTKQERRAARRAMENPHMQQLTEPSEGEWCVYLPIADEHHTLGVVGIPMRGEKALTLLEKNLLISIAAQCAQMIGQKSGMGSSA